MDKGDSRVPRGGRWQPLQLPRNNSLIQFKNTASETYPHQRPPKAQKKEGTTSGKEKRDGPKPKPFWRQSDALTFLNFNQTKLKEMGKSAFSNLIFEARLLDGVELTKCLLRVEHLKRRFRKKRSNKLPNRRVCFCFCSSTLDPHDAHLLPCFAHLASFPRSPGRNGSLSGQNGSAGRIGVEFRVKMSDYLQWRLFWARNKVDLGPGRVVEKAPLNCSFSLLSCINFDWFLKHTYHDYFSKD